MYYTYAILGGKRMKNKKVKRGNKIRSIVYGAMFGLVMFGIMSMCLMTASGDMVSSNSRSWETTWASVDTATIGAKGVSVTLSQSYSSSHGAHIGSAFRGHINAGGDMEWVTYDLASTASSRSGSWRRHSYTWTVLDLSFNPTNSNPHRVQRIDWDGMTIYLYRVDYTVRCVRNAWWSSRTTYIYEGLLQQHIIRYH